MTGLFTSESGAVVVVESDGIEVRRVRREKFDAASELAANTFVIFAGKRRLIAAKLHSFVTQM